MNFTPPIPAGHQSNHEVARDIGSWLKKHRVAMVHDLAHERREPIRALMNGTGEVMDNIEQYQGISVLRLNELLTQGRTFLGHFHAKAQTLLQQDWAQSFDDSAEAEYYVESFKKHREENRELTERQHARGQAGEWLLTNLAKTIVSDLGHQHPDVRIVRDSTEFNVFPGVEGDSPAPSYNHELSYINHCGQLRRFEMDLILQLSPSEFVLLDATVSRERAEQKMHKKSVQEFSRCIEGCSDNSAEAPQFSHAHVVFSRYQNALEYRSKHECYLLQLETRGLINRIARRIIALS